MIHTDFETVFCIYMPGSYDHDFISNVVTAIDSYGVFVDYISFNLCIFLLTYVFPIRDMIDREYHVLLKNELARIFFIVWRYVLHTTKAADSSMSIYGSVSSKYDHCR